MNFKQFVQVGQVMTMALMPSINFADIINAELKAPLGYYSPVKEGNEAENNNYICEQSPLPFTGSLQFSSKYEGSDSARDQLNKDAEEQYKKATASIALLEKNSIKMAENYLLGKPGIASRDCLISWLDSWAKAGALLSTDSNHTGMSVRKWALASTASAYFSIKAPSNAADINTAEQQSIESWFAKLADQVVVDWSNRPVEKRNNHDYWAAWSVMISSVILNRQDLFDWANISLKQGLAQINSEGFLPNELKRGTRALNYHNYSLQPLIMLTVFSAANNSSLTDNERLALFKLISITAKSIEAPALFEQKTGNTQFTEGLRTSYSLAWVEPYTNYFGHEDFLSPFLETLRPMKSTRMGGDLTRIFKEYIPTPSRPPVITEIK